MTTQPSSTFGGTSGQAVPGQLPTGAVRPGLGDTVASEWLKLRTSRAPRRNLLIGVLLGTAFSALLSFAAAATFDEWTLAQRMEFDPISYSLSGGLFVSIFFIAVGVNVVTSEYATGMIRLTFAATPNRGRVLLGKVIVVSIATTVAGFAATVAMLVVGQVVFSAYDLPTVGPGDVDLWRTIVSMTVLTPVFPVLSVVAAFLMRSTAAAVSSMLALLFVPSLFGALLPGWVQRNVLSLLPGAASDSVAIGHLVDSPTYLHPVAAAAVLVGWMVGALLLARFDLDRRDA